MRLRSASRLAAGCLAGAVLALGVTGTPATAQLTYLGQTFTAPVSPNPLLTSLTVSPLGLHFDDAASPLSAQIYAFNGTSLVGASLFTQSLGTTFAGFTLTPMLALSAGARYAVVVGIPPTSQSVFGISADNFVGGSFIACDAVATPCEIEAGHDVHGFAVAYAPVATVPEPGTWALLGTGLLAVGGIAPRRRRTAA
jgi:hypothetical protein